MGVFDGLSTSVSRLTSNMTTQKLLIICFIVILLAVAAYFLLKKFIFPNAIDGFKEQIGADADDDVKDAEIMMFYVDWCPHCKTAKPEWSSAMEAMDGKVINGHKVQFTEVNCTDESPEVQEMVEKFNIEGYPTIKLIKGDQVIDFEAKPTKDTITQFLNTAL